MEQAIAMTGELEPRGGWEARRCSIAKALEVVHTRSAFLILREAFYGASRFDEFSHRTRLSEPVTAARLRELEAAGLLEREDYQEPGQRTRRGYQLTQMGQELLPALVALMQWGDRWLQDGPAPVALHHAGCGAPVTAELRCAHDHEVGPGELELVRPTSGRAPGEPDRLRLADRWPSCADARRGR
jgi:DNA-binding HxlR family transcriptional regulator